MCVGLDLLLVFVLLLRFSLDCFVLVLFAFVVLGLVSSVLRQDIGWEECLQNDLLFVEWDETLTQSINLSRYILFS